MGDSWFTQRLFSAQEIESTIIEKIEELAENYQFFEYGPIEAALEEFRKIAKKRSLRG